MNNSSDSESCLPSTQHVSIPVLLCLVYFIGFILNVFSLWVFCCRLSSWTAGTVLQFNLALSDALAPFAIPLIVIYFVKQSYWPFEKAFCQIKIALLSSHFYGSTIFLTLISVHRYTAVVHFNRSSYMKDKGFIKKICAGVWLLLLVLSLVYAFLIPSTKVGDRLQCLSFSQKTMTNSLFIINFILFILGFLLPLSISATCYCRVANTLTRLITNSPKGLKVQLKSQQMIRMCLIIFGICFLPMNITRTLGVVLTKYYPKQCQILLNVQTSYYTSWILAGMNCCLDPALYCFGSQIFRDAFPSFRIKQDEPQQRSELETTAM